MVKDRELTYLGLTAQDVFDIIELLQSFHFGPVSDEGIIYSVNRDPVFVIEKNSATERKVDFIRQETRYQNAASIMNFFQTAGLDYSSIKDKVAKDFENCGLKWVDYDLPPKTTPTTWDF